MRAFIIRPFGEKNDIDFDAVERLLIDPALRRFQITGRTTMEISRQGNIRLDMFRLLLTADLVVADISIHNANVYYELGVRHALRGKRTFMLRARGAGFKTDEVPFDLRTDRYLAYDGADPAASLPALVEGLRQTINSEEQDSPVFQMLPELPEQSPSRFLPIPLGFREEVERAKAARQAGDLELLASEARGFEWETEGLRVVGRAQFDLRAWEGARSTWEAVRDLDSRDHEANTWLGTIYQRLGDLTRSDQALRRALARQGRDAGKELERREQRAEIHALLGRNAKERWRQEWERAPEEQRRTLALRSPHLEESFEAYQRAFREDLNHFYSGLNAVAMLTVHVELAQALPAVWSASFETDEEAGQELGRRRERLRRLSEAVGVSLEAAAYRLRQEEKSDVWAEISEADLTLLTSRRPERVANAYRKALADAPDFAADAARVQVLLYRRLGILAENTDAALSVMGESAESRPAESPPPRVLLFTGHMIDAPGRERPRFPPDPARVTAARQAIGRAVAAELREHGGVAYGIAGGASGGDILFHQACEDSDVTSQVYLALPRDEYVKASVAPAGAGWVAEFERVCGEHPVRVLGESDELPRWLQGKPGYGVWQRSNLWMLYNALAAGSANVTLIALWDGQAGDGPGGTSDMVEKAAERGAKTVILDTKEVFGL